MIFIVILGFLCIGGLAGLMFYKIDKLRQVAVICTRTILTLKELQLLSSELLSTNDLDSTFYEWRIVHQELVATIDTLNGYDHMHDLLDTKNQKALLDSLYAFWLATGQKIDQVDKSLETVLNKKNHSKNGMILQYLEKKAMIT